MNQRGGRALERDQGVAARGVEAPEPHAHHEGAHAQGDPRAQDGAKRATGIELTVEGQGEGARPRQQA
jgi:hypothetical protein